MDLVRFSHGTQYILFYGLYMVDYESLNVINPSLMSNQGVNHHKFNIKKWT